jgi:hypothetical protein
VGPDVPVFWLGSWATTLGSACSPRASATREAYTYSRNFRGHEKDTGLSDAKAMFVEMKGVIG